MNTTMADGAEQRLDAQIAEALFGQPGMSKMDVANRVRELRGDGPALLVGGPTGGSARLEDSLPPLPCTHYNACGDGSEPLYTSEQMRDYARAARQPVGESMWVEIRREGDRTFPRVMERSQAEAFLRTCNVGPLPTIHTLYAAPPAQAVDLRQFHALAAFGEEFALSAEKQPQSRVIYAQARRLLALIDGKAVGNGPSVGMADLEQILLDPENQPSQFGTVPTELLEKCEEMISDLVHQFGDRGCTCTFPETDCCAYARAEHYSRDGAANG